MTRAVKRSLERVGLSQDEDFLRRYPSQISVGQAQRVLIGIAIMHSPPLLIADEPTSALDVLTQMEVLQMLSGLTRDSNTALLYISHDLQSVASICQRVAILYDGEIVECGSTAKLLQAPNHPYTRRLASCVPWLRLTDAQPRKVGLQSVPQSDEPEEFPRNLSTPSQSSSGLKSSWNLPISL